MMNQLKKVSVFAPATIANLAVGFDILGCALHDLGDEITLIKSKHSSLTITHISGEGDIPYEADKNTATVALQAMLDALQLKQGFELQIKKRIPLGSGLGGSAACSVAPLIALNRMLLEPLPLSDLVDFALSGEEISCGAKHPDNVIPCLFGGMTLIQSLHPLAVIGLPLLPLQMILLHPHLQLDPRDSRTALKQKIELTDYVKQSAQLAAFITALYEKNYARLASCCQDELIEPMRAHLIPGFYDIKKAALEAGALAYSISGSGPTLFAFAKSKKDAKHIARSMGRACSPHHSEYDIIISTGSPLGAKVIYAK